MFYARLLLDAGAELAETGLRCEGHLRARKGEWASYYFKLGSDALYIYQSRTVRHFIIRLGAEGTVVQEGQSALPDRSCLCVDSIAVRLLRKTFCAAFEMLGSSLRDLHGFLVLR